LRAGCQDLGHPRDLMCRFRFACRWLREAGAPALHHDIARPQTAEALALSQGQALTWCWMSLRDLAILLLLLAARAPGGG